MRYFYIFSYFFSFSGFHSSLKFMHVSQSGLLLLFLTFFPSTLWRCICFDCTSALLLRITLKIGKQNWTKPKTNFWQHWSRKYLHFQRSIDHQLYLIFPHIIFTISYKDKLFKTLFCWTLGQLISLHFILSQQSSKSHFKITVHAAMSDWLKLFFNVTYFN